MHTVVPTEMTLGPTKNGKLRNVLTHSVIFIKQRTQSLVFCWLCALCNVLDYFEMAGFEGIVLMMH